jgi:hypothetical protein
MSVVNIIQKCEQKGIRLQAVGDKLHYRGPRDAITEMVPILRENKFLIINILIVLDVFNGHFIEMSTTTIH